MGTRTRSRGGTGQRRATTRPSTEVPEIIAASSPPPEARRAVTGLLLRFISCGLIALGFGLAWRFTLAPAAVGPGTAFAGIFVLLLGFIAGGLLWYLHDARRRSRAPDSVSDERLVFSFIVFAVVPFAVLLLIGLVWLVAFLVGVA